MSESMLPSGTGSSSALSLCRLFGWLLIALAGLSSAYSAYLTWYRLPAFKGIFIDFRMPLPASTMLVLDHPWLPLAGSLAALGIAGAAVALRQRALLVLACFALVVAVAGIAFTHVVVEMPLIRLSQSISGA